MTNVRCPQGVSSHSLTVTKHYWGLLSLHIPSFSHFSFSLSLPPSPSLSLLSPPSSLSPPPHFSSINPTSPCPSTVFHLPPSLPPNTRYHLASTSLLHPSNQLPFTHRTSPSSIPLHLPPSPPPPSSLPLISRYHRMMAFACDTYNCLSLVKLL